MYNVHKDNIMWLAELSDGCYSMKITHKGSIVKETVIEGLENILDRIKAFKLLYDGNFDVVADFNYNF